VDERLDRSARKFEDPQVRLRSESSSESITNFCIFFL
jgi:hypothetical protein